MVNSRRQAIANALAATRYPEGWCARWVRGLYGVGPAGDVDKDGDFDAVDSWRRATKRHRAAVDDVTPPAGVPVYWSGGSKGHGHIAITVDGWGAIESTDWPSAGVVGSTTIDELTRKWGLTYLGWSEDIHGQEIPTGLPPRRPAEVRQEIKDARAIRDNPSTGKRRRRIAQTVIDTWKKVKKQ